MVPFPADEENVFFFFPMILTVVTHTLSNESVWLELKRPRREAELSNLSNSEATCIYIYIYVWGGRVAQSV